MTNNIIFSTSEDYDNATAILHKIAVTNQMDMTMLNPAIKYLRGRANFVKTKEQKLEEQQQLENFMNWETEAR